jgi:hypothetical protein
LNNDTLSFKDSLDKVIEYCIRDKISAKSNLTNNTRNRFTIIQDSINVDAEIEDVDPAYHIYGVNLYISKGNDRYQIETVCEGCDTVDDVIDTLQSLIQWKGKYLLVPTSCGGGNAWRCETTHIFMILDNRLLKVGEGTLGTIDKNGNGIFRDFYDKYETNDLTCHADAPGFILYMYENNGALKVDLDKTWEINQNEYQEYRNILDILAKQSNAKSSDNLAKLRPVVFNSVLCRYCQKQDEILRWNKVADIILDDNSKVKLDKLLSSMVPGEMPWIR